MTWRATSVRPYQAGFKCEEYCKCEGCKNKGDGLNQPKAAATAATSATAATASTAATSATAAAASAAEEAAAEEAAAGVVNDEEEADTMGLQASISLWIQSAPAAEEEAPLRAGEWAHVRAAADEQARLSYAAAEEQARLKVAAAAAAGFLAGKKAAHEQARLKVAAAKAAHAAAAKKAALAHLSRAAAYPAYVWIPNEPQLKRLDEILASGISFSRGVEVRRCSLTLSKPVLKAPVVLALEATKCHFKVAALRGGTEAGLGARRAGARHRGAGHRLAGCRGGAALL